MRGELIGIWSETWNEIWDPLSSQEDAPPDLFCELYREFTIALKKPPTIEELADVIDDPVKSKVAFEKTIAGDITDEQTLSLFIENAHPIILDLGGEDLANHYFNLLLAFLDKFNLRYDLRRPCTLCPTLPGVFATLFRDLRATTSQDPYLDTMMKDFELAIRDLRIDRSDRRIKACIRTEMNLLEAIGRSCPGVTRRTLGEICDEVGTWPHEKIKLAMKSLYGFASDYPGIRHAGTQTNAIRTIDMRDMVAMSILLAGFTPYLSKSLNPEAIYHGN